MKTMEIFGVQQVSGDCELHEITKINYRPVSYKRKLGKDIARKGPFGVRPNLKDLFQKLPLQRVLSLMAQRVEQCMFWNIFKINRAISWQLVESNICVCYQQRQTS